MRASRFMAGFAAAACAVIGFSERIETTKQCYFDGAWSDVCRYENVCFNGSPNNLVVITDTPGNFKVSKGFNTIYAATKLPKYVGGLPYPERLLPIHYKADQAPIVVSPATFEKSGLSTGKKVVWSNDTIWIPSYFDSLGNIWYYSSRVLPIYTANLYRDQWQLPSPDHILLFANKHKVRHSWHNGLLESVLPDGAQVAFAEDEPYLGLAGKTWCFKRAVLLGSHMFGFPDMVSAHEFRRTVYTQFNIPIESVPKTPQHVVILDRPQNRGRHFANLDAMKAIIAKYNVEPEYVVITTEMTYAEQVELMARTGVLVTMHGAGLMNEIFMPPGSTVIEIFPVHHKHVLYERIAHYSGVYHFKVYSREFEEHFHDSHKEYMRYNCDKVLALSISDHGDCWPVIKNANIVTPLPEFEVAFVNALDTIGVRTKLSSPTAYTSSQLSDHSLPPSAAREEEGDAGAAATGSEEE